MGGTATFVLPLEGYRKHLLDSAEATSTVFI